ncbi:MAG: ATP-dependent protease ATPase subunit HslU [Planctomycetota bacterium]
MLGTLFNANPPAGRVDPKALTPRQIVAELDRYIIGQREAKKAIAIALRNRYRRRALPDKIREEVTPKNIMMIGPTGVGKTEIARRLATLAHAPFIKIEATKFTEVGYVGRDVESMVRDLVKVAFHMALEYAHNEVLPRAREQAEERLLDTLLPAPGYTSSDETAAEKHKATREKLRKKLADGELDAREVEITLDESRGVEMGSIFTGLGNEEMGQELQQAMERMMPKRKQSRKCSVKQAREVLTQQEQDRLVDKEKVAASAVEMAQTDGIIFLDEIDKICATGRQGNDVSREGVQRDLLPIVEGSTVNTRWGMVKTDHMLFIAAGAFHHAKPSDLLPELQGRFPLRVELQDLTEDDYRRILSVPENALTKQYAALLETEGVQLKFAAEAVHELAAMAVRVNAQVQNIGARRLHTLLEKLIEDISFEAPEKGGESVLIDKDFVLKKLGALAAGEDLAKYIL